MSELISGDDKQGGKSWTSNKIEIQMTTDHELLAKIDEVKANLNKGAHLFHDEMAIVEALRAVVELCTVKDFMEDWNGSDYFIDKSEVIEAIEKVLG